MLLQKIEDLHLYEIPRKVKSEETENREVLSRVRGGEYRGGTAYSFFVGVEKF